MLKFKTLQNVVIAEEKGELKAIIIATGSEVSLAMEVYAQLEGVRAFQPCAEEFMKQDAVYREAVLPAHICAREAAKLMGLLPRSTGLIKAGLYDQLRRILHQPNILFQFFGITTEAVNAAG